MTDWYNIDAIEQDVRDILVSWGVVAIIDRTPTSIDVYERPLIQGDDNSLWVAADGGCSIHWSMPRGIALQSIVERHTINERRGHD